MTPTSLAAIFTALNSESGANCEFIVRDKSSQNALKMDFATLKTLLAVEKDKGELLVDLGLPSGRLWATRNIDVTRQNGFAESPYTYACSFFSWGNTDGHNPISNSAFEYNFGSANDGPYASTPGASITYPGSAGAGDDAATMNLGGPWRLPTTAEFKELFDNCIYINANGQEVEGTDKRVTVNGVMGILLQSRINGKKIFFACSGSGYGTSWTSRGSLGDYWSSSLSSATSGRSLLFYSGGVDPQYSSNRFFGFAVRPVQ